MRLASLRSGVFVAIVRLAMPVAANEDPDTEIARRYFEQGRAAYERRDYVRAIERFEAARRIQALPAFDYNIARCFDRLDQPERAVAAYRQFLDESPEADVSIEVRERVRVLDGRILATGRRLDLGARPMAVTSTTAARPRRFLAAGITLGATLVVTVTAAGLVGSVGPRLDEVNQQWDRTGPSVALRDEGLALERRAIAGYAMFGLAGALAVVDAVLWGIGARR